MGLYRKFINQTRKPEGALGKMMVNGMNSGHAKMADWGMTYLPNLIPSQIAELGCGGGRNAGELSKRFPLSKVIAVDYSEVSVAKAKEYNKEKIDGGKMIVQQGDVSNLNLPAESFDLATAFETIYFWPGLEKCFAQVYKILKPGGIFMVVNESDGTDDASLKFEKIIDGMRCYTVEQISSAMKASGFSEVTSDHFEGKPWITVIARK